MSTLGKGIGGHHRPYRGKNDEWITPKYIIDALGPFDLDPCIAETMPWQTATVGYTKKIDGLTHPWLEKKVWCNPPYGPETAAWLKRCAEHNNCIVLTFARVDTKWFHSEIFQKADAILFLAGRLTFYTVEGKKAPANSGGPSCLVAYGGENALKLQTCGLPGCFVSLKNDDEF